MNAKRQIGAHEPYGNLGRAFSFSRDDLAANQAGFMSLAQEWRMAFWERKLYLPVLTTRLFRWLINRYPQPINNVTGKVRKHFHNRIISIPSGGAGGGYQDVLQQYRIAIDTGTGVETFYVREKQYEALPDNIVVTVYYEPEDMRILSVKPPYDEV